MCGIAGILLERADGDRSILADAEKMAATLYHRGPDGSGSWHDGEAGIALVHRRLAIIDLSEAGHQPMASDSGDLVITYNGEIYNFKELRDEFIARGHQFRGHSDTEVMLACFETYGIEESVKRFAGMFAFAVWDRRNRVLHLARDRMGKKPLYIGRSKAGALIFASELKALRACRGFEADINPRALEMVLRQGWVSDNACIWQGVAKLAPGHVLSVAADKLDGADIEALVAASRPYWSIQEVARSGQANPHGGTEEEMIDELDQLVRLAVRQRMIADVPLGAFLSGGIDSSTITGMMQAEASQPVKTYTIGFGERQFNEATHADAIAQHLGTDHTEFQVTPTEAQAVIPELSHFWDEPFADESQVPTLLLTRLARQHVTVALSGDGGDECFAGYHRHFIPEKLKHVFGMPMAIRRTASAAIQLMSPGAWDRLLGGLPDRLHAPSGEKLIRLARILDVRDENDFYERTSVFGPSMLEKPQHMEFAQPPALPDAVARSSFRDMIGYLPGDILVKTDRASMAASLEARCPFLDHRVVEFAWRLPSRVKVRDGNGKWILRRVLERYVPRPLFERPKQGFNVPVGAWIKGPLRDWAEALLDPAVIRRDGLLDADLVSACWQEHLLGKQDNFRQLWAVLMVQAWLESVRSGDATEAGLPPAMASANEAGQSLTPAM